MVVRVLSPMTPHKLFCSYGMKVGHPRPLQSFMVITYTIDCHLIVLISPLERSQALSFPPSLTSLWMSLPLSWLWIPLIPSTASVMATLHCSLDPWTSLPITSRMPPSLPSLCQVWNVYMILPWFKYDGSVVALLGNILIAVIAGAAVTNAIFNGRQLPLYAMF